MSQIAGHWSAMVGFPGDHAAMNVLISSAGMSAVTVFLLGALRVLRRRAEAAADVRTLPPLFRTGVRLLVVLFGVSSGMFGVASISGPFDTGHSAGG